MLVLTRKMGESIVILQCAATVTVVQVRGKTVRLGIAAPADLTVHREEVWRRGEPLAVSGREQHT